MNKPLNPFLAAQRNRVQSAQSKETTHDQAAAYVRGEIDTLPAELPAKAKASKPKSFAELIAQKQAENAKKKQQDDLLRGSGITKRDAERAERQFEKQQQTIVPNESGAKADHVGEQIEYGPKTLNVQFAGDKDIILDESQQAALTGLRFEQFGCLIGAAGTGKTTVTKQLIAQIINDIETIRTHDADAKRGQAARDRGEAAGYIPAIAACAYTGTATENVKKALGTDFPIRCDTIHGILGFYPIEEEYQDASQWKKKMKFVPYYTASNPLPWKVIIIDEAGMLGIDLWHQLIDACLPDCRIIMIGDINQLPPVQGRSVLGFAMLHWPTFALEKIHRQAADSPIIANAHRILQGKMPISDKKNFIVYDCPGGGIDTFQRVTQVVKAMAGKGLFNYENDAIITSVNEEVIGQKHFNQALLPFFNGPREENGIVVNPRYTIYGGRTQCAYAVGDKVMVLSNDREAGITNGMIGFVINIVPNHNYSGSMGNAHIDGFDLSDDDMDFDSLESMAANEEEDEEEAQKRQASHIVTVRFPASRKDIEFKSSGDFGKLAHAYAFTCHKSQGKEYPTVVIVAHSKNARMMSREWLYTAVTRAQKIVFLCCNNRGLLMALQRQNIRGNTVKEKAESFIALMDKKDTKVPMLPEPKKID